MAAAAAQFTPTSNPWMQVLSRLGAACGWWSRPVSFALMLVFQGVAALPVVVAQFVVNGALFLFLFQALPGGRSLPVPELGSRDGGYCQCGGAAPASPW
jgi:hypothetical protein